MTEKINKSELARRLEVKPPYISKLVKSGKLTFDDDGLIDYKEALRQLNASTQRVNNKTQNSNFSNPTTEENLNHWKTETEKWKSLNEKLDYEENVKNLIPKEEVQREAYSIGKILSEQLLSIPERFSDIFAAETDAMVIREMWLKETKRLLNELSDKLGVEA
jgi:hypothetical protein